MKKLILVLFVIVGCGGLNKEQKQKDLKDSLEAIKVQNINLKAKLNSLTKTNNIDSLSEINAINEILGDYESNEQYLVQYAAADIPGGPTMIIGISQIKDKEIRNKAEKKHKAKVVVNTVIRNVITTKVVQKPSDLRTAKIKEKVIAEIKAKIKVENPTISEKEKKEITLSYLVRNNNAHKKRFTSI